MSDSDDIDDAFPFSNDTVFSVRGPNFKANGSIVSNHTSSIQSFKSRYNMMSTHMNPYRREQSPMSVASACDIKMRQNDFNSFYPRGMSSNQSLYNGRTSAASMRSIGNMHYPRATSSQRSIYNGRTSPAGSVRSMVSTASHLAIDVAMALKNREFNEEDLRIIHNAYNKYCRVRKKRRRHNVLLKAKRVRSGSDSGSKGSVSSLSSDDDDRRSTRTGYKENMSRCRSTKTDISDFHRGIRESRLYNDCTDSLKQNSFRSMVGGSSNLSSSQTLVGTTKRDTVHACTDTLKQNSFRSMISGRSNPNSAQMLVGTAKRGTFHAPRLKTTEQTSNSQTQQDRFKNGFLLPCQRFNKAVPIIPEGKEKSSDLNSDDDNIFGFEINTKKRSIEELSNKDICLPQEKRPRVTSPKKNKECSSTENINSNCPIIITTKTSDKDEIDDFIFAKPIMPVRKTTKEKILSKSAPQSLKPVTEVTKTVLKTNNIVTQEPVAPETNENQEPEETQNNEISMRPSFIKRKLFTQKLDVAENKNESSDSIAVNSPSYSIYSSIQKEKHKTRKLVTSQSCLNRDIGQDESTLLDLIHKIVPQNSVNTTYQQKSLYKINDIEKWDITSIISAKNSNGDISDTFTDEEVFENNNTVKEIPDTSGKKSIVVRTSSPKKPANGIVKMMPRKSSTPLKKSDKNKNDVETKSKSNNGKTKHNITELHNTTKLNKFTNGKPCKIAEEKKCLTFWDLDSDSDAEALSKNRITPETNIANSNMVMGASKCTGIGSMFKTRKPASVLNASISTATSDLPQRLNITSFRIRSHRAPKINNCCQSDTITSSTKPKNFAKQNSVHSTCENNLTSLDDKKELDKPQNKKHTTKLKDTELNLNKKRNKKSPQKVKDGNTLKNKVKSAEKKPAKSEKKQITPKKKRKEPANKPQQKNEVSIKTTKTAKPNNKSNQKDINETHNTKWDKTPGKIKSTKSNPVKNKQNDENKEPNKNRNTHDKPKKRQRVLLENSSLINDSIGNDSGKVTRAIRSCRLNSSLNSSKESFSLTMNKTLRSRIIDISSSINNKLKDIAKNNIPSRNFKIRR